MEAMQSQTVDVVKRMKEITLVMRTPEQVLEEQGVTAADIEGIMLVVISFGSPMWDSRNSGFRFIRFDL